MILLTTAASLGIFHTAIGVDHYIPFVAMSKANNWSFRKTMWMVFVCGLGHVCSSVLLGFGGIWLGSHLSFLVGIETFRGEMALWFLIAFGLIYMLWGIRNAIKNKPHRHIHADGSQVWHSHKEHHGASTIENHKESGLSPSFWPLFILLVLGPCEPLIPLLLYPAADTGMLSVVLVALVFSVCTIGTMLFCTAVVLKGIDLIPMKSMERYSHALAGFAVFLCGIAIQLFGI